jgi:hypothetical protein
MFIYTEFQPVIWVGFELFTRPCSIFWKGRKRNGKSIVSKPTRFSHAKTKESITFPAPLLQGTILQSVKIIHMEIGRFSELSATLECEISTFKSAIDHWDCDKCVTKAVGNAAETGNEGQIHPHLGTERFIRGINRSTQLHGVRTNIASLLSRGDTIGDTRDEGKLSVAPFKTK